MGLKFSMIFHVRIISLKVKILFKDQFSVPKLLLKHYLNLLLQGTSVPKLTLGPFLTLSVRNGHKLKDWVFRIPAHIASKSRE